MSKKETELEKRPTLYRMIKNYKPGNRFPMFSKGTKKQEHQLCKEIFEMRKVNRHIIIDNCSSKDYRDLWKIVGDFLNEEEIFSVQTETEKTIVAGVNPFIEIINPPIGIALLKISPKINGFLSGFAEWMKIRETTTPGDVFVVCSVKSNEYTKGVRKASNGHSQSKRNKKGRSKTDS